MSRFELLQRVQDGEQKCLQRQQLIYQECYQITPYGYRTAELDLGRILSDVSDESQARRLLFKVAASNQGAIVSAVDKQDNLAALKERCILLLRANRKIDAIKEWRNETAATLKDAKDAVEALL